MIVMREKAILTNEIIAEWSQKADEIYRNALQKTKAPRPAVRLGIEETLLRFRDHYGTDSLCSIRCHKDRNALRFVISQPGVRVNPLTVEDVELSVDILEKLDLKPQYSYRARSGVNTVIVPIQLPPRKNEMLLRFAAAVLLAIMTGWIAKALPGGIGDAYIQPAVSELFKKLSSIFSAIATPLVFCAVINGISGLGSVASFGKVGVLLLKRMLFTYLLAVAVMVLIGLPFGLVTTRASAGGGNVFQQLLALVLDMIPGNLIEPFRIDNDLQVIVLAIFIGAVMLTLGEKISRVRDFISEVGDLVNQMMRLICRLLPFFVYLGISDLILGNRFHNISKISLILFISLAGAGIVIAVMIIRTKAMTGLPLKKVFSAQLPSLMINLTTSSQVSALPESIKCCKDRFGIDSKVVDFGLPLGIVIYMPNGAIMLGSIAWVLTVMSSGPVDAPTTLKIAFAAMTIAIAAPPIPGSAFAVMPILFSVCGTDLSMMPLAVIVASTAGYLLPAVNGFCLQLELLMTAWKSDLVDKQRMTGQAEPAGKHPA